MKFLLTLLFALITGIGIHAQIISYGDYASIIPYLQKDKFEEAFDKTNQLLSSSQNDSSFLRGTIIYMNIRSAAGMVALGKMTHEYFLENVKKYTGQRISMFSNCCIPNSVDDYNCLKFSVQGGQTEGVIATTNTKANILCYEHFKFANSTGSVNPANLVGKKVSCSGFLESVDINQNNLDSWIPQLEITRTIVKENDTKSAAFFETFLRTPFAILTCIITIGCFIFVGFFELFGYLFSGFEYNFPITHEIWNIGWKSIVQRWWWNPGVGWHLIISIFIWLSIFSSGKSRKQNKA